MLDETELLQKDFITKTSAAITEASEADKATITNNLSVRSSICTKNSMPVLPCLMQ